jgi:hypothetical protein
MAITVTSPASRVGFIKNAVSADASGCEEIIAATPGKQIKIRHLTINNGANALSHTIGEDKNGAAVKTALIGPIAMPANSSIQWDFNPPMELTAGTALVVDSSGNGAVCVFTQGDIE